MSVFVLFLCSECFRTSYCSWCKSDKNGNLVDGFCDRKEKCPFQQCLKNGINLSFFVMLMIEDM